jgi:hypothetical protein
MTSLYSLAWRYLLVATLVLNPVAGASAAVVASGPGKPAAAEATEAQLPPCHATMAHHDAATDAGAPAPTADHGCGCGNAACEFGACCGIGALDVPDLRVAESANLGALALSARDATAVAAPPASRMIRPPIG